jgi:hypothetical protein
MKKPNFILSLSEPGALPSVAVLSLMWSVFFIFSSGVLCAQSQTHTSQSAQPGDFLLSFDNGQKLMFAQQITPYAGGGIPDSPHNELLGDDFEAQGNGADPQNRCFRLHDFGTPFPKFPNNTYLGATIDLTPRAEQGVNLMPYNHISIDMKLGSPEAHASWTLRVEDGVGAQEWNNKTISLPPLTDQFQRVRVPLSAFIDPSVTGNPPDLQFATKIVVSAEKLNELEGPYTVDLLMDNIRITAEPINESPSQNIGVMMFYHPENETSMGMKNWMMVGQGSALRESATVRFIDVAQNTSQANQYGIVEIPTLLVFSNGKITSRVTYRDDFPAFLAELQTATGIKIPNGQ